MVEESAVLGQALPVPLYVATPIRGQGVRRWDRASTVQQSDPVMSTGSHPVMSTFPVMSINVSIFPVMSTEKKQARAGCRLRAAAGRSVGPFPHRIPPLDKVLHDTRTPHFQNKRLSKVAFKSAARDSKSTHKRGSPERPTLHAQQYLDVALAWYARHRGPEGPSPRARGLVGCCRPPRARPPRRLAPRLLSALCALPALCPTATARLRLGSAARTTSPHASATPHVSHLPPPTSRLPPPSSQLADPASQLAPRGHLAAISRGHLPRQRS